MKYELRVAEPNEMAKLCDTHKNARLAEQYRSDSYGFKLDTGAYSYYLWCFPKQGDYNAYIYCYDRLLLAESIKQKTQENGGMNFELGT